MLFWQPPDLPAVIETLQVMVNASTDPATQTIGGVLMIGGVLLNLISELFIMPFWQIIKAIIYYDLRNRREGSDLTI